MGDDDPFFTGLSTLFQDDLTVDHHQGPYGKIESALAEMEHLRQVGVPNDCQKG